MSMLKSNRTYKPISCECTRCKKWEEPLIFRRDYFQKNEKREKLKDNIATVALIFSVSLAAIIGIYKTYQAIESTYHWYSNTNMNNSRPEHGIDSIFER